VSAVHGDYLTAGFVEDVADLNHGGGPEISRLGSPIKVRWFFFFLLGRASVGFKGLFFLILIIL
jgi:hypothetical protein